MDFLLDKCFKTEQEEMETIENINKLLLDNVMPPHVGSFFMGKDVTNQVNTWKLLRSKEAVVHLKFL